MTIEARMQQTGWTRQQVTAELEMMKAAAKRYQTGKLTDTDRKQIAEFSRHYQRQGKK